MRCDLDKKNIVNESTPVYTIRMWYGKKHIVIVILSDISRI